MMSCCVCNVCIKIIEKAVRGEKCLNGDRASASGRPPTRWVVDGRAMDVQRWTSHLTAGRYDDDDDDDH